MEYVLGKCTECENVMSMPGDSLEVRCPSCQAVILATEAAEAAGTTQDLERAQEKMRAAATPFWQRLRGKFNA